MSTENKLQAMEIPLTMGLVAIVDEDDYKWLHVFKWHTTGKKPHRYAVWSKAAIRMHRMIMGDPPDKCVDHINGNTLDNRKCNLRICTKGQNNMNAKPQKGTSKYKGVFWDKSIGYYRSQIRSGGICYRAKGVFKDETSAARAYDNLAREHHGEFAYFNFPQAV